MNQQEIEPENLKNIREIIFYLESIKDQELCNVYEDLKNTLYQIPYKLLQIFSCRCADHVFNVVKKQRQTEKYIKNLDKEKIKKYIKNLDKEKGDHIKKYLENSNKTISLLKLKKLIQYKTVWIEETWFKEDCTFIDFEGKEITRESERLLNELRSNILENVSFFPIREHFIFACTGFEPFWCALVVFEFHLSCFSFSKKIQILIDLLKEYLHECSRLISVLNKISQKITFASQQWGKELEEALFLS